MLKNKFSSLLSNSLVDDLNGVVGLLCLIYLVYSSIMFAGVPAVMALVLLIACTILSHFIDEEKKLTNESEGLDNE